MGEIGFPQQPVQQPLAGERFVIIEGSSRPQQIANLVLGWADVRHLFGQAEQRIGGHASCSNRAFHGEDHIVVGLDELTGKGEIGAALGDDPRPVARSARHELCGECRASQPCALWFWRRPRPTFPRSQRSERQKYQQEDKTNGVHSTALPIGFELKKGQASAGLPAGDDYAAAFAKLRPAKAAIAIAKPEVMRLTPASTPSAQLAVTGQP